MKPFQNFHSKDLIQTLDSQAICKYFKVSNDEIFSNSKCKDWFYRLPLLEHFGVYYKDVMYYLSTNPDTNVVKHILDEGYKIRLIEQSKIPNHHLMTHKTQHLQG
jgi:hypothetical protein